MKFKHIKWDNRGNSQLQHWKYMKVWNYKDEVLFQIKNGHTTKGLGYNRKGYECNEPQNNKWYKKISSNKKLNKKMTILHYKYKEYLETKKVFHEELDSMQKEFNNEVIELKKAISE